MKLGFITSNKGKLLELQKKISTLGIDVTQLPIAYPELQADTIDEVARFGLDWILNQAENIDAELEEYKTVDLIFLEDSGLFVHALGNFPGVYSKFTFNTIGYNSVLELMKNKPERSAHFESCIAASKPRVDKVDSEGISEIHNFKGTCYGLITNEPRGDKGFGFDPIFQPEGAKKTFAEMETEEKNKCSHRGMAMHKFVKFLNREFHQ
jgi:XTP/dITP diphosphohydrolase